MKKLILLSLAVFGFSQTTRGVWQFCNPSQCSAISVAELYHCQDGEALNGWSRLEYPSDCSTIDGLPNGCSFSWVVLDGSLSVTSAVYTASQFAGDVQWRWNCAMKKITPSKPPGVDDGNDGDECGGRSGRGGCTGCGMGLAAGMPAWRVSEPYLSLWVEDEPLSFQPALGPRVALQVAFKQQDWESGYDRGVFGVGKRWNCSWLSYVTQDGYTNGVVHFGSGATHTFTNNADYFTNGRLSGDTTNGFTVLFPDGSSESFRFVVTNSTGSFLRAFLTERLDPSGRGLHFTYENYAPADPVVRLANITDGDGLTTTLTYAAGNAFSTNLISQVTDPFGRTATLAYDSAGRLTGISDVAGLPSTFEYGSFDRISAMTTPYGTTTFTITDTPTGKLIPNGRSITVTEPDGAKQLYLFTNGAPGVPNSYSSSQVPGLSPYASTLDNSSLATNNSFYWDKRQYAALSAGFLASGSVGSLTTNDYLCARMRHWLRQTPESVSATVSLERAPSPDGLAEGQKTWYDYAGKTNTEYLGTQSQPLVVATVLPDGATSFTRTERNSAGRPTSEVSTYSAGAGVGLRTNTFLFAANGIDLVSLTNALGLQTLSNVFNALHQVTTNWNALGEATLYTYDGASRLSSTRLPSGLVVTNLYYPTGADSNRIQAVLDYALLDGSPVYYRTNAYTYTNGLLFTQTDPRGLTVTNTRDALQRLRRVDYPDGTFVTNVYDKLDLVQVIDRMGFSNSFAYDSVQHRIAATNAAGTVTRYGYCPCGSMESQTNAFGTALQQVIRHNFDLQGNRTQTTGPDDYTITYHHNALGQVTNITDGVTSTTNYFNSQGLLTASYNAAGQVSRAIYDALDRATNTVDSNGVTVTNAFDNLNRLLTRSYPDGGVEWFGYTLNVAGETSHTNQLGSNDLHYAYDPLGRKTAEMSPGITTNSFVYTPAGDLLTLTDGKNQTTTWNYDEYGRTTNKVDALGQEIFRYAYDPDGRLTNRWTPAKGTTVYAYDPVGNLTTIQHPVSSNVLMAYDLLNRLTNMVDAIGTTKYTYTAAGQLLSEDGPWTDDAVSYSYQNRLRTGLSLAQPRAPAWVQGYAYDAAGHLTNVTSPAGAFAYEYTGVDQGASAGSLVHRLALPNTAAITNDFDAVGRLLSTTLRSSGGKLLNSHAYLSDLAGQRTRQTRTDGSYVGYTYDGSGRLITAIGKEPGGATNRLHEWFGYAYDAAGNLNRRTNNALVQEFGVNDLNELVTVSRSAGSTLTVGGTTTSMATNVTVNGLSAELYGDATFAREGFSLADGTNMFIAIAKDAYGRSDTNTSVPCLLSSVSFAYDLNGNLRTNGTTVFDYDDENQLIAITEPGSWKTEFVYDGKMRRRIRKEFGWREDVSAWQQTNEVRYVYDANLVIQERWHCPRLPALNAQIITYTRGPDLSGTFEGAGGIGGCRARTDSGPLTAGGTNGHAYYHADANGNITALVNANQTSVGEYLYDPYGNVLSQRGPLAAANSYRFSSKEVHSESGLVYYLYRYHHPGLQRWLNRDPIDIRGGMNLYAFVLDAPVNLLDTFGLSGTFGGGLGVGIYGACRDAIESCKQISHIVSEGTKYVGLGGKCCNRSKAPTYYVDNGAWHELRPGECTSVLTDCDGMMCGGEFYPVALGGSIDCEGNGRACDSRYTVFTKSGPFFLGGGPRAPQGLPNPRAPNPLPTSPRPSAGY